MVLFQKFEQCVLRDDFDVLSLCLELLSFFHFLFSPSALTAQDQIVGLSTN